MKKEKKNKPQQQQQNSQMNIKLRASGIVQLPVRRHSYGINVNRQQKQTKRQYFNYSNRTLK